MNVELVLATSPFVVVVDTREQTPWHFDDGIETVTGTLGSGDYSIVGFENAIAVERKTLDDFVRCCGQERPRFMRELERLAAFQRAAVVVEANLSDVWQASKRRSAMRSESIAGSVASFFVDFAVPIFFASDRWTAADYALRLLRIFHGRAMRGTP